MSLPSEPVTLRGGRYWLGSLLGHGGFSLTHRAQDTLLGREVVVKELFPVGSARTGEHLSLPPHIDDDLFGRLKSRFLEEARHLAQFQSEDVVRVQDVFEEAGTAFLVLDAVEGQTLREAVETHGPLNPDEGLELARRLAGALQTLHVRQVLHRDLKPDNVVLRPGGRPVLIDFGAAVSDMLPGHSRTLTLTHGFAPLEQYGLAGPLGPPTDLYGLSATLYYAATGTVPPSPIDRLQGTASLDQLARIAPVTLRRAVEAGLEIRAADRPQTAADLLALLGEHEPSQAPRPVPQAWSTRLLIHLAHQVGMVPDLPDADAVATALQQSLGLLGGHREQLEQAYGDLERAPSALADDLIREATVLGSSAEARQALLAEITQALPLQQEIFPEEDPGSSHTAHVPGDPYREHVFAPPAEPNLLRRAPVDLADMLTAVVRTEGPVHQQEAFRRVAAAHGVGKVGSRIADALEQALGLALGHGRLQKRGEFLWPPGITVPPVRNRAQLASRTVDQVCDEEIAEAARIIRQRFPQERSQEHAVQTARLLGFSRLTEGTRQRIVALMPEER